jgi:hypothetical protein
MSALAIHRPTYDEDYHAWTLDQARRLRAFAKVRPDEPIDWVLLAEEVEDMGRSQRDACEAFLEQIIAHLLKIEYAGDPEPIGHWRREIEGFRIGLERKLTPSIEHHLRKTLAERYRTGRRIATAAMALDDVAFGERPPKTCPYTFEQLAGDWLPARAEVP